MSAPALRVADVARSGEPCWSRRAERVERALLERCYDEHTGLFATERDGCREYYDRLTGAGLGGRNFGWSTLLMDLV